MHAPAYAHKARSAEIAGRPTPRSEGFSSYYIEMRSVVATNEREIAGWNAP